MRLKIKNIRITIAILIIINLIIDYVTNNPNMTPHFIILYSCGIAINLPIQAFYYRKYTQDGVLDWPNRMILMGALTLVTLLWPLAIIHNGARRNEQ